ncbi:Rv3654c family TadE-like protein [Brevibacterium litoralis]|uniref:Rv3654c family TadE-like protein n=1 Tax=Brevibacterium litoralis TaxID=3138935 RepID=UPI0032EECD25
MRRPTRTGTGGERPRGRGRAGRRGCDQGAATPVALFLAVGSLSLVAGLGLAGQSFLAHARADGTADLAALAAADAGRGLLPGSPCETARDLVEREGGTMVECIADAVVGTAVVTVEIDLPPPLTVVRARAVAGPDS